MYREVFFAVGPHEPASAVADVALAFAAERRGSLRASQLFVRVLDDAGTRAAGLRWAWLAAPAGHSTIVARAELEDAITAAVVIAHDDLERHYSFRAGAVRIVSHGEEPSAIERGLRRYFPRASIDPWSYLRLVGGGLSFRVHDRNRAPLERAEYVIAPPSLAGCVDHMLV